MAGWSLIQKGRSLGSIILLIIPFGWFLFFALDNKKTLLLENLQSLPASINESRSKFLTYQENITKLRIFEEREADLFNSALVQYENSSYFNTAATEKMRLATKRFEQAAVELNKRIIQMDQVPKEAAAMQMANSMIFTGILATAKAQSATIEASIKGYQPNTEYIKELSKETQQAQKEAAAKRFDEVFATKYNKVDNKDFRKVG